MILWLYGWLKFLVTSYFVVRCLKFAFIISKSFLLHIVRKEHDLSCLLDSWAVVTGGTDGIGRAYIFELARARKWRKFYLLGRNESKLSAIKEELESEFGCEVRTLVFNFATDDLNSLPNELRTMDVGLLLNCVGIVPDRIGNFAELEEGIASKVLRVNLESNVRMNELILPGMLAKDRGVVINVSSMTGWRPYPYLSFYPASKAAISFFSDSLSEEFGHTNVRIQCLIPLMVASKISKYETHEANNLFVVSAENFAKQAVRLIGKTHITTGCWQHDIQIAFGTLVSAWFLKKLYVPLYMLTFHKKRIDSYVSRKGTST